jgi:tetratricopeptide (TPR) repeat protein
MRIRVPGRHPFWGGPARRFGLLSLTGHVALLTGSVLGFCLCDSPMAVAQQAGGQTPDISIIPKSINDTFDRVQIRNGRKNVPAEQKTVEVQDSCLLPPLTFVRSPVVAATALAVPAKANKEYLAACAALKEKKNKTAEKHLRKAVQIYPKYSAAWVTLGQMLEAQNQTDESRSACAQASTVEPNYLPALLCLAELAAREKAWSVVLQFSSQVLAIDPTASAVAYEYSAAASLRMNKLDDAEKSAQRALEIDKNNSDPRVHFLLAQIYEAKGDRFNEILQLKEYLKFAGNTEDAAAVGQYLTQLEKSRRSPDVNTAQETRGSRAELPVAEHANSATSSVQPAAGASRTVPEEPDPPAPSDNARSACNLDEVLPQVQRRIQEFVENVQKFTATELLEDESITDAGKVVRAEHGKYDYVVSIEESVAGMLAVNEFQNSRSPGTVHPDVVTKGLPALLLIFHPYYAGDFAMTCEGLKIVKGNRAWQIRFRQRDDKPSQIRSYRVGTSGAVHEVDLQGRAWFMADTYQIVKLEADLIKTIPEIQLTVDHTSAEYGPVHFLSRGVEIWLPQTADLVSERKGKRLHERISFSDYLLFAVDNKQEIASPKPQEWLSGSELCWTLSWCVRNPLFPSDALARVTQLSALR